LLSPVMNFRKRRMSQIGTTITAPRRKYCTALSTQSKPKLVIARIS
jgi:hypothetical protein